MRTDPNCVFCKIVAGQIPALKVFEDQHSLAFLDIGPLADGHLLIIPKEHYARLDQIPPQTLGSIVQHFPRLARAVIDATGAEGYNLLQNNGECSGQEVEHVHFHIIPRVPGDGLGYRWKPKKYPHGRDKQVHQSILEALGSTSS